MKGFILNTETSAESNAAQNSDAMHFYGVLENGKNFVWKETQAYILGFVSAENAKKLQGEGLIYRSEPGFKNFRGDELVAVFFLSRLALANAKKLLSYQANNSYLPNESEQNRNEEILESSHSPTTQFLASKGIKSSVNFLSEGEEKGGVVFFSNPKVQPTPFIPNLKVLSFDIETGVEEDLLYSISLVCGNYEKVLVLNANSSEPLPPKTEWVASQALLLKRFFEEVQKINPNIITGWFLVGFDFKYLARKAAENDMGLPLGIAGLGAQTFIRKSGEFSIFIPGRAIIDAMDASTQLLTRRPINLKLGTVAHFLLGVGKIIESSGMEKVNEITEMYHNNKARLSEYNLVDSKLVLNILNKLQAIPYYIYRASLSYLSIEKVLISQAQLDSLYLQKLHQKKIAGFDYKMQQPSLPETTKETEIVSGIYENVVVFSLKNLPILCALKHNLDPLGMAMASLNKLNEVRSSKGFLSHSKVNILSEILLNLQNKKKYVELGPLSSLQLKAISHQMYSLMLGLETKGARFFLPMLLNAIKNGCYALTQEISKVLSPYGKVLFFDTNIMYLQLNNGYGEKINFNKKIEEINSVVFSFLKKTLKEIIQLNPIWQSIPEDLCKLDVTRIFKHFYLAPQKCDALRSNYVRFSAVELNGQVYKRSIPNKAVPVVLYFEQQLLNKIFGKEDVESFLQNFREDLLRGLFDEKLVYKTKLSKPISQHANDARPSLGVQAALKIKDEIIKKQQENKSKSVYYVITTSGPLPYLSSYLEKTEINYTHYLEKELMPVAKKVLKGAGMVELLSTLSGKSSQLGLF